MKAGSINLKVAEHNHYNVHYTLLMVLDKSLGDTVASNHRKL